MDSSTNESSGITAVSTTTTSTTAANNNGSTAQYPQLEDKGDFAIVKWLASFEPHNLPESLSTAFRLGPLQDKLKITKPIVWLANLSCDFKSAYATIDDPNDVYGPSLGGRRRSSDGKRTYPRQFTSAEKKRFELLQDEYHNQRWQNLLVLGYDPATAATMVGALRDKHMRVFSPPPLFTLSPRMIVTDEEKRMKMKATVMGYLDGLAKQAEKELLEDLDREIAEEQQQQLHGGSANNSKGKNAKKKAKKKAAAAKKKTEISSPPAQYSTQQPPPLPPPKIETVEEKRRRIEFAVAEARRKQNEAEQLKLLQLQQLQQAEQKLQAEKKLEEERAAAAAKEKRPSSPGPLSPDQMRYLREQQLKQKPHMLENYDEKDRQIIREALERTGLNEEDVTKDVTTTSEKDGKGMPYAWCCDFCKTATFPTFAEAALHETTCDERPKTPEEMEAVNKEKHEDDGDGNANAVDEGDKDSVVKDDSVATPASNIKIDVEGGSKKPQDSAALLVKGGGLPYLTTHQRGIYAAKKLADTSKEVNVAELMDSLALEWSEKKAKDDEPLMGSNAVDFEKNAPLKEESNAESEKAVEDDVKPTTTLSPRNAATAAPIIPSVDYSEDESDSDDDLNLEQFVKTTANKSTPAKKTPSAFIAAKPKMVEVATPPPPSEKSAKQPLSEKELAKALIKKEKKRAAAAAKKEKKKAAAAATTATTATSNQAVPKDNISQKKVAPPVVVDKTVPAIESGAPQINQKRPPPGLVHKSSAPMYQQQNGTALSESEIVQVMKSSTIDYGDRVNDTALPRPPVRSNSPSVALEQTSDLFIMQDSSSPTPHAPPPPHLVQLPIMSNFSPSASASQPISPSFLSRLSSLTADNEVLIAKTNFLESENRSLRAEVEALRNQMAIDRQSAVEALQRVQLKSYISDTAKDAAEERATWFEAILVDAVVEMTTREVVRIETNEAIKAVSYAAVQLHAMEQAPSYQMLMQQIQSSSHRSCVLPPLDEGDQHTSAVSSLTSLRSANGLNSFSFEGDLSLGQYSSQSSGGILPQAPWARDEGVFARLRRGDDA